jgi:glutaredoxin
LQFATGYCENAKMGLVSSTYEKDKTVRREIVTTVYSKPACVQCDATKKAMDKLRIDYQIVDISEDSDAREYVMALGYLFF